MAPTSSTRHWPQTHPAVQTRPPPGAPAPGPAPPSSNRRRAPRPCRPRRESGSPSPRPTAAPGNGPPLPPPRAAPALPPSPPQSLGWRPSPPPLCPPAMFPSILPYSPFLRVLGVLRGEIAFDSRRQYNPAPPCPLILFSFGGNHATSRHPL